jgi:hypothetical protein
MSWYVSSFFPRNSETEGEVNLKKLHHYTRGSLFSSRAISLRESEGKWPSLGGA